MNTQRPPSWLYDICLSLTSVTWYGSHSVHPGCWQRPYSAPLCEWAVFLHREICLRFPVKGRFGGFGVLANVHRAALKTGKCVLFWNMTFFLDLSPEVGLLDCTVSGCWSFVRNLHAVFHVCCTSLASHQECRRFPLFICPLQHLIFVDLPKHAHFDLFEGIHHCTFDLLLSNNYWCWASFRVLFGYLYVIFQKRQWQPTPILLPGKSHGQRSLVGCRLWGR